MSADVVGRPLTDYAQYNRNFRGKNGGGGGTSIMSKLLSIVALPHCLPPHYTIRRWDTHVRATNRSLNANNEIVIR